MLILVRHGRTDHNATGRLVGRLDVELDELGLRQAAATGDLLRPGVARVISSPLTRARATAETIAGDRPVEVDDRWVELDYGELDGVPMSELPSDLWRQWILDLHFRPPGGETLAELGERVRDACRDLADQARDEDVVVVTHVSPLKAAVAWALGAGDELAWRLHVATASISRITIGPRGPVLASFNETSHRPG
jgi:broad specificity phosphatase PhoE